MEIARERGYGRSGLQLGYSRLLIESLAHALWAISRGTIEDTSLDRAADHLRRIPHLVTGVWGGLVNRVQ